MTPVQSLFFFPADCFYAYNGQWRTFSPYVPKAFNWTAVCFFLSLIVECNCFPQASSAAHTQEERSHFMSEHTSGWTGRSVNLKISDSSVWTVFLAHEARKWWSLHWNKSSTLKEIGEGFRTTKMSNYDKNRFIFQAVMSNISYFLPRRSNSSWCLVKTKQVRSIVQTIYKPKND